MTIIKISTATSESTPAWTDALEAPIAKSGLWLALRLATVDGRQGTAAGGNHGHAMG